MRFGSVCSGIEAASVAWHPLGWQAAWFSEIEPFPCAVLAHHYPEVPNHGDMTALPERIRAGKVEAPDLFCGGTPCQAFSVAGLRRSLDDERGNLSLTFVEIADAIDDVRRARGDAECIVFWENVPGVLSTQDNAFGCFLGALAGCDTAIEPLAATGWTDAGVVAGPQRTVAWRVLDAQYFGLAQRRKRVFVVASAREGFDPTAVLLEWEGVRRDSAPSREAREAVTPTIDASFGRLQGCSGQDANHGHGHLISMCLNAKGGAGRLDAESETLIPTNGGVFDVAHTLRGEGFDASEDGAGRGTPLVPVAYIDTMPTMRSGGSNASASHGQVSGDTRDEYIVPGHAFDARQSNVIQYGDKTGPLDTDGHSVGVAIPIDTMNHLGRGDSHSFGDFQPGAPSYTLTKGHSHAVAALFIQDDTTPKVNEERAGCRWRDAGGEGACVMTPAMQVRRLTPVECERLQGFPDHYTAIPWRGKPASECPDGPRYKALGNSWAVPCVRWIGARIARALA